MVLKLGEWLRELQTPEAIARIKERFEQRETITDEAYRRQIQERQLEVGIEDDWYKKEDTCSTGLIIFCPFRGGALGVEDKMEGSNPRGVASTLEQELHIKHGQFSRFKRCERRTRLYGKEFYRVCSPNKQADATSCIGGYYP